MTEKYVTANGVKLAYDEFGDPSKPAIILIMGLGTQMIAWPEALCEQLADSGFRVIRYDNRDIGLSEKMDGAKRPSVPRAMLFAKLGLPFRVPYTLADMADDCIGLMDGLSIDKAHIVGASMGGMIGQIMTAKAPLRVLSFTSIMSTSGDRSVPSAKPEVGAMLLRKTANTPDQVIQQRVEVLRLIGSKGDLAPSDEELRGKVLRSHNRCFYPDGYLRHLLAIAHSGSRVKLLKSISRPTLVIHGKADVLVPIEGGIDTARHIPNARLELIDDMGHDLPAGLIPRFAELISEHARQASS